VVVSGKKFDEVLAKLDWGLLAFFLGLFVLIAGLDFVHLLEFLAEWLASILPKNELLASTIILWVVAIISGIVDNIVVAAAFGPVLFDVATLLGIPPRLIAWATIFGANFGGGFTPIGAPSAVVGLAVLYKKTGEKMGWGEFFKTQGLATTVRLFATIFYLAILSFLLPVIPID
jgi:Na+/H+ antiporter NhaD/arsenite permease-like protein